MGAIFKREIRSYFTSPIAYIYIAVFYLYTGMNFVGGNIFNATSDMSYIFSQTFVILMIMLPLLTMRLMSEEKRQKTDQCLLTSPVSLSGIVLGKFFAALCVFVIGMAVYIPYMLVLYKLAGGLAWASAAGNMLALLLLGASFISIGIFMSSLTENQIVSAILSFIVIMLFYMIDVYARTVSVEWISSIMVALGFYNRYSDFTNGIISIPNILFFLSAIFIFNFLTVRVLEKRRWE